MKKYLTLNEVFGYVTKPDKTNAAEIAVGGKRSEIALLVSGSQNVLIDDAKKVKIRKGYTLDGAANTALNAIESSVDWEHSRNGVLNLRSYDDELEVRFTNAAGTVSWVRVLDAWAAVDFVFTTWWDTEEDLDLLLFVNGDSNIYEWSGGVAEVLSVTSNSITKRGTPTWAQSRFYAVGDRNIVINGTTYAYTGGQGTTTLTGVTPNPSTGGVVAGDIATQAVVTRTNIPTSGLQNDIIATLNNQVYVGSLISNEVRASSNTDHTSYTFSSPRTPGQGATLTLDQNCVALVPQEDAMYIATGRSGWYRTDFVISDNNLNEILQVKKLKTGVGSAPLSHDLMGKAGDYVTFINNNKELVMFGRLEQLELPNMQVLSDHIKPDFDDETFTNGHLKFHKNRIYIATPTNDKLYISEVRQDFATGQIIRFWQPPQILPIRRLAVIGDNIYGHSSAVPETYQLFDDTDDNGRPFKATAAFAYRNFGDRVNYKSFDEYFVEGYIAANTKLLCMLFYDFDGFAQTLEFEIDGANNAILFQSAQSGSLGDNPLGDAPLGDQPGTATALPKFRVILSMAKADFHELQVIFETNTQDATWEILSQGPAVTFARHTPVSIKA